MTQALAFLESAHQWMSVHPLIACAISFAVGGVTLLPLGGWLVERGLGKLAGG